MADRLVVSTMLTAPERCRVDAAGTGAYDVVHRDSIDQVVGDVRAQRAQAVVVSVACCESPDLTRMEGRITAIVRDFPRVTTLALLSDINGAAPSAMLLLGRSGVRTVVDARRPDGWRLLRETLTARSSQVRDIADLAITQLAADLRAAPPDCRRFFLMLFSVGESVTTVAQLGRAVGILPSTLISRFARRGLPSPKVFLSWARLVRAAALLENPGVSMSAAATALDYSSPQGFSRHLRLRLGLSAAAFRREYTGPSMLARFRRELITPYLETLLRLEILRTGAAAAAPMTYGRSTAECPPPAPAP